VRFKDMWDTDGTGRGRRVGEGLLGLLQRRPLQALSDLFDLNGQDAECLVFQPRGG